MTTPFRPYATGSILRHVINWHTNRRYGLISVDAQLLLNLLKMQEPRMVPLEEVANLKPRKKKPSPQVASTLQINREIRKGQEQLPPTFKTHKSSKRGLKKEASPSFQQMDRSPSDFLPDSSMAQNEYRTLRRKYLLLEEKSASMMKELNEVEADVNTLEDEKFVLLDRLVVMEGLVDPSELEH